MSQRTTAAASLPIADSFAARLAVAGGLAAIAACRSVEPPDRRDDRGAEPAKASPPEKELVSELEEPVEESPAPHLVTYAKAPIELRGFLYRPPGPGPFPAVVFNHGSEQLPGPKENQAEFYVAHGYVLFVPHRRGHGRSGGDYFENAWNRTGRDGAALVALLDAQVDDVAAAVAYVKGLPEVDGTRIAVAGCSFGGIQSLLAAERDLGIRAAIDFAGAAIMWARTPPLQERMKKAARASRVPVFFLQAENDFDTTPSRVLDNEMRRAGRPSRMQIFPPRGSTHMDGHSFCRGGEEPAWGPAVLEFLRESMPEK